MTRHWPAIISAWRLLRVILTLFGALLIGGLGLGNDLYIGIAILCLVCYLDGLADNAQTRPRRKGPAAP